MLSDLSERRREDANRRTARDEFLLRVGRRDNIECFIADLAQVACRLLGISDFDDDVEVNEVSYESQLRSFKLPHRFQCSKQLHTFSFL